jgi:hypothetical protein
MRGGVARLSACSTNHLQCSTPCTYAHLLHCQSDGATPGEKLQVSSPANQGFASRAELRILGNDKFSIPLLFSGIECVSPARTGKRLDERIDRWWPMKPDIDPGDWSTSYSQYLARSAAVSARTLNLYQLALERISRGELPATIFQDHFPRFAAAHGTEFMNRFANVGSRFLTEVVQIGSGLSQHPAGVTASAAEGETAPPQFDPSNPARWYEQIAEYAGELNARAVRAYRAQLDRVAAGETTPSEVQQQTADQMAHQLPGYMQRMTRLYFDLLNGLNDVRSAYEETYFRGLLASAKPESGDRAVALMLAGSVGGTAAASLCVTNATGQRTQIGHQITDVRREDGAGPSLVPAIVLAPKGLELGPEEEGTLTVSLWLDPEQYDTNALYKGALYLTGGSEVPLEVELRILATDAAAKSSER